MSDLRVDWFEATLECETVGLLAYMQMIAGSDDRLVFTEGKGRHGYSRMTQVDGMHFHIEVFDLGNGGWPHIKASGPSADLARRIALALNVVGRVSRVDIASDTTEGWLAAEKRVLQWADDHPKSVLHSVGDFYRGLRGRTYYVGSAQSSRRVRIYEKGIQTGENPDWVRIEYQFRPHTREEKAWAFNASIEELANSSRAFVALRATEGLYTPPNYVRAERQPILALARQYGNVLREHVPEAWHAIYLYLKS